MKEKLQNYLRKMKREQLLVLGLLGLLLLVLALPVKKKEQESEEVLKTVESSETTGEEGTREELQKQLEEALYQVEGVGEVKVMITMDTTGERVVEKDTPDSSEKSSQQDSQGGTQNQETVSREESTVYEKAEDGRELPYVTSEILPQIRGVLVIAQGGGNPEIVQQIQEAVEALFHLEAHKIKVMKMK